MSNVIQLDHPLLLLVVILNYRSPDLTIDCLRSLVDEVQSLIGIRIVVSDNASGDGSVEKISAAIEKEGWSNWASVMPLEHNGGFAFGNNAVIRVALQSENPPPYFLLLNPDTIVRPGALKALLDFMNEHPDAGIASSRLENPDGTSQGSAFRFHNAMNELNAGMRLGIVSKILDRWIVWPPDPEEASQTDWVAGTSMMIRREVFEQVGLLDEEYFMYYEDVDFCLHAKRAGWSCWYVPQSRIIHLEGQSSGVSHGKRPEKRRPQYWFDARRRYYLKNHGLLYAALADALWTVGFITWRIRRVIQSKPDTDPPQMLSDFLRNSVFMKR